MAIEKLYQLYDINNAKGTIILYDNDTEIKSKDYGLNKIYFKSGDLMSCLYRIRISCSITPTIPTEDEKKYFNKRTDKYYITDNSTPITYIYYSDFPGKYTSNYHYLKFDFSSKPFYYDFNGIYCGRTGWNYWNSSTSAFVALQSYSSDYIDTYLTGAYDFQYLTKIFDYTYYDISSVTSSVSSDKDKIDNYNGTIKYLGKTNADYTKDNRYSIYGKYVYPKMLNRPFLKFSSDSSFTINVTTPKWDGEIQYSSDGITWVTWDGTSISSNTDNILYIRGLNNKRVSAIAENNYSPFVITGSNVTCSGDIGALLDYRIWSYKDKPQVNSYGLAYLFYNCSALISPPTICLTTLPEGCFYAAYSGCTNLVYLPYFNCIKTMSTKSCYAMFNGCTSLKINSSRSSEIFQSFSINPTNIENATNWNTSMFLNTGGTFKGTPVKGTTYYTQNGLKYPVT